MKQRKSILRDTQGEECSVAVWQRQSDTNNSSTNFDTRNLKHNDSTTDFNMIDSRHIKELIDFNNSDGKITTACQVRKRQFCDDLNGSLNRSNELDRNPEDFRQIDVLSHKNLVR